MEMYSIQFVKNIKPQFTSRWNIANERLTMI
jgi:hypothetical protein